MNAIADLVLGESPVATSCRHEVILPVSGIGITTALVSAESPSHRAPRPAAVWQTDSAVRQTIPPPGGIGQAHCRRHPDDW
jgi:hypothetical protein